MAVVMQDAVVESVRHYLRRSRHLLALLSKRSDSPQILAVRLAPDMFDTALHFAVAIRFAARALCPLAGGTAPDIPQQRDCDALLAYADQISQLIAPVKADQLAGDLHHQAGKAVLTQSAQDYICQFALPNMLFHLTMAYAGMRHAGMAVGKADFDGFHSY